MIKFKSVNGHDYTSTKNSPARAPMVKQLIDSISKSRNNKDISHTINR